MTLRNRLAAALEAFKDPALIGEARGLREVMRQIPASTDLAVLQPMWGERGIEPKWTVPTFMECRRIRSMLGPGA